MSVQNGRAYLQLYGESVVVALYGWKIGSYPNEGGICCNPIPIVLEYFVITFQWYIGIYCSHIPMALGYLL